MRPAMILVPLGLALASAGGVLLIAGRGNAADKTPILEAHVRHPVTKEMLAATGAMSLKPAPLFKLNDIHGIPVQLGGAGIRPQFVYFILDGCPCSIDAQPLFNRMYYRYKDKADFIGVINVDTPMAKNYAGDNTVLAPIVADPQHKIILTYGAISSVYCALIRPDGAIEKMWPGYSKSMLSELNTRLAKMTQTKEQPFDAAYAPTQMASGCAF